MGIVKASQRHWLDCSAALWRGILRQHYRLNICSWYWYWLNCQLYHVVLRLCARYYPSLCTEYMCRLGNLIVNQKTHITLAQDSKSRSPCAGGGLAHPSIHTIGQHCVKVTGNRAWWAKGSIRRSIFENTKGKAKKILSKPTSFMWNAFGGFFDSYAMF